MATKPTHEQAQLQLQLYDLRREAKLRQARDWYTKNFFAETLDDAMKIAPMGSENGAFFMMVVSYWDQACALLNYGLLHEELFFETSSEFFFVFERLRRTLAEARKRFGNPTFMENLEKASLRFEEWSEKRTPGAVANMRKMMQQMAAQMKAAAKA